MKVKIEKGDRRSTYYLNVDSKKGFGVETEIGQETIRRWLDIFNAYEDVQKEMEEIYKISKETGGKEWTVTRK